MYMHLTFHDGSNPYVTFNKSGDQIKAIYHRWSKGNKMPLEMIARIDVYSGAVDGLRIYTNGGHGFRVAQTAKFTDSIAEKIIRIMEG